MLTPSTVLNFRLNIRRLSNMGSAGPPTGILPGYRKPLRPCKKVFHSQKRYLISS